MEGLAPRVNEKSTIFSEQYAIPLVVSYTFAINTSNYYYSQFLFK